MNQPMDDAFADRLRAHLRGLLEARHSLAKSLCPTEAARELAVELKVEWRELMRPIRHVACELVDAGAMEVIQDGIPVSLREARGPVKFRLKQRR